MALAIVATLPDADVVVYPLGLNAPHILGHRGLTHSLAFAAVMAALLVRVLFRDREWHASWARLWVVYFAAIASHGVLDAFTNGGQGIAFFAPLSAQRWHAPWQPILVSPIGVGAFLSGTACACCRTKCCGSGCHRSLVAATARLARRARAAPRRSPPDVRPQEQSCDVSWRWP